MASAFFDHPILNSPYDYPGRHWQLDHGQPTGLVVENRRRAEFISPIPKPRRQSGGSGELFDETEGLSNGNQKYDPISIINEIRAHVDAWRHRPPGLWLVTPETARLLNHWRHHSFQGVRPFFCQVEAVETAIWLTEVAPKLGKQTAHIIERIAGANRDANPTLMRLALKLATGAGKDHCYGNAHRMANR